MGARFLYAQDRPGGSLDALDQVLNLRARDGDLAAARLQIQLLRTRIAELVRQLCERLHLDAFIVYARILARALSRYGCWGSYQMLALTIWPFAYISFLGNT